MNIDLINEIDKKIEKVVKMIGYSDLSDFRVKKHLNELKKEIKLKAYDSKFSDTIEILKARLVLIDEIINMSPEERLDKFII